MNEMNTINEQMGEGMMQSTPKKILKRKKRERFEILLVVIVVVVVVVLRNCCCRFKTTEMKSEVVRSEAAKFNFGFVVVVVVFLQRNSWLQWQRDCYLE
jgi:hypothetical protein